MKIVDRQKAYESPRESDIRIYEGYVKESKLQVLKHRLCGSLLLAAASAEGSGAGFILDRAISNGNDGRHPEAFAFDLSAGSVAFGALIIASAWQFFEAHGEKQDNEGNQYVLDRLKAGGYVPGLHSSGGAD